MFGGRNGNDGLLENAGFWSMEFLRDGISDPAGLAFGEASANAGLSSDRLGSWRELPDGLGPGMGELLEPRTLR